MSRFEQTQQVAGQVPRLHAAQVPERIRGDRGMRTIPVQNAGRSGPRSRIAVVVIHGMGEQEPMQTLRGFVNTVWERDGSLFKGLGDPKNFDPCHAWTEPDDLSGPMELRRITTRGTADPLSDRSGDLGVRADFFELHWADLTVDTTWSDFRRWLTRLLWRHPREVPPRLRLLWGALWLIVASIFVSGLASPLPKLLETLGLDASWLRHMFTGPYWAWLAAGSLALGGFVKGFATAYFGDVARYVSAAPHNIRVRKEARERGLKLLSEITNATHPANPAEALPATGRPHYKYERIVLVGHSLGSVLAHDLVWLAWNELSRESFAEGSPAHLAVQACERAAYDLLVSTGAQTSSGGVLGDGRRVYAPRPKVRLPAFDDRLAAFRLAQRDLFRVLARRQDLNKRWLISDLVTIGSPLTHASVLIARNAQDLETKVKLREVLHCPLLDNDEDESDFRFSYRVPDRTGSKPTRWQMHHGSAMGAVRWTNIHDASGRWSFPFGDLISGPLSYIENSPNFGAGVVDVRVKIRRAGLLARVGLSRLFTHTQYWNYSPKLSNMADPPAHVQALREAINVLDDEAVDKRLMLRARDSS